MRPDRTIHVALCIDAGFALPLAVCLASLDAVSTDRRVVVHVVHPGLEPALRDQVTRGLANLSVHWIRTEDDRIAGAHHSVFLTQASLYRLLLGDLLPRSIGRVIYLDADTIVADSLAPLHDHPLEPGMIVGAVSDAQSPWAAGPLGPPWRELGLDPSSRYFNSGVLLIDLDRWREDDTGHRCLELLRRVSPTWGDQDGLNTVLENRWQEIPRRWNVQSADVRGRSVTWALWKDEVVAALDAPAVVHYTEGDKPWLAGSRHPEADRWFSWLDRTSWSGWRPVEVSPSVWETWARSAAGFLRSRLDGRSSRLPV